MINLPTYGQFVIAYGEKGKTLVLITATQTIIDKNKDTFTGVCIASTNVYNSVGTEHANWIKSEFIEVEVEITTIIKEHFKAQKQ